MPKLSTRWETFSVALRSGEYAGGKLNKEPQPFSIASLGILQFLYRHLEETAYCFNFSLEKHIKKYYSVKGPYIYSIYMESGWGSLEIWKLQYLLF